LERKDGGKWRKDGIRKDADGNVSEAAKLLIVFVSIIL